MFSFYLDCNTGPCDGHTFDAATIEEARDKAAEFFREHYAGADEWEDRMPGDLYVRTGKPRRPQSPRLCQLDWNIRLQRVEFGHSGEPDDDLRTRLKAFAGQLSPEQLAAMRQKSLDDYHARNREDHRLWAENGGRWPASTRRA
jgi:hypothetical protein